MLFRSVLIGHGLLGGGKIALGAGALGVEGVGLQLDEVDEGGLAALFMGNEDRADLGAELADRLPDLALPQFLHL